MLGTSMNARRLRLLPLTAAARLPHASQAQQQAAAAQQQQQQAAVAPPKPLRTIAHTLLEGGLMDPAFYHALGQVGTWMPARMLQRGRAAYAVKRRPGVLGLGAGCNPASASAPAAERASMSPRPWNPDNPPVAH